MTFDALVKQLLVLEAPERLLGRSFSPQGISKSSTASIEELLSSFVRGEEDVVPSTYIRKGEDFDKELKAAEAVAGDIGETEAISRTRNRIEDIVNKFATIMKDEQGGAQVSGPLIQSLVRFNEVYHPYRAAKAAVARERGREKHEEAVKQMNQWQIKLVAAVSKAYDEIRKLIETANFKRMFDKDNISKQMGIMRVFEVWAISKAPDNVSKDPDTGAIKIPFENKYLMLHDFNNRLKSALQTKSSTLGSKFGTSVKRGFTGWKKELSKLADKFESVNPKSGSFIDKTLADAKNILNDASIEGETVPDEAYKVVEQYIKFWGDRDKGLNMRQFKASIDNL